MPFTFSVGYSSYWWMGLGGLLVLYIFDGVVGFTIANEKINVYMGNFLFGFFIKLLEIETGSTCVDVYL